MKKRTIKAGLIALTLTLALATNSTALAEVMNQDAKKSSSEAKSLVKSDMKSLTNEQKKEVNKAIESQVSKQQKKLETVNKGILEAFKKVDEATQLLAKEGNEKEAIKMLEVATGKFDVALAAEPKLSLIPIDAVASVHELLTTPETLKAQSQLTIDLIKDNKLQAARALMLPMQDELLTVTTYLPMTTYPDVIKEATKNLIDGKKEEAVGVLAIGLSTFVREISVIPLAVIRAESMLNSASMLDKEKDKVTIKLLLRNAESQLEIATLLGYTDKNSATHNNIKSQIVALKKEIDGGNVVERMYSSLKSSFKKLIDEQGEQKVVKKEAEKSK
jgi:hypothetical protein